MDDELRYLIRSRVIDTPWGKRMIVVRDPYYGPPVDETKRSQHTGGFMFPEGAQLARHRDFGGLHYVESLTRDMTWERREEGFEYSERDGIPIQ